MEPQYLAPPALAPPCYNVATLFQCDEVEPEAAPNYLNNEKDTSMAELANMDINDGQDFNALMYSSKLFLSCHIAKNAKSLICMMRDTFFL